jgi:membrane protease subunit HflK
MAPTDFPGPRRHRQPVDPFDWAARNPKKLVGWLVVAVILAWFVFVGPFYTVAQDEQGLVLTFGRHTNTVGPGFHFKFPWPVQTVHAVKVEEVKRIEIGFRTTSVGPPATYRDFKSGDPRLLEEAQMLTGDENIVNLDLVVQFRIKDAAAWEFNVKDPVGTLRDITEAAIRQVVGDRLIDEATTTGKTEIQAEVKQIIQGLADRYTLGAWIQDVAIQDALPPAPVADAFQDVATSIQDKDRFKQEAEAYSNQKIPEAEGQAEQVLRDAEGRKAARIAQATGDADRFLKLAGEYEKAPEVTRERLLLEVLERVLPLVEKVVIDKDVAVLHLNQLGAEGGGR